MLLLLSLFLLLFLLVPLVLEVLILLLGGQLRGGEAPRLRVEAGRKMMRGKKFFFC